MGRVSVWIPDELAASIKAELPDVNVSRVLREGLESLLGCRHDDLACSRCGTEIHRAKVGAAQLSDFYVDVMGAIAEMARDGSTVEGVARRVRALGRGHGVELAHLVPLPVATRAEREASREAG